jgi:translation initiation factor IF-3
MTKTFKEMRFRPNIAEHDLLTKTNQICKFLENGMQVRIVVQMSGRENLHKDLAIALIESISDKTAKFGKMDPNKKLNGNAFFTTISPIGGIKKVEKQKEHVNKYKNVQ